MWPLVTYSNYFEAPCKFIVHWPTKDQLKKAKLVKTVEVCLKLMLLILIAVPYGFLIFMGSNFCGFHEVSLSLET